jgi:hypothetical protein
MWNLKRFLSGWLLLSFSAFSLTGQVNSQNLSRSGSSSLPLSITETKGEITNIFSSSYPETDLEKFKVFARQMARLKPFGRVDISVNNLAEKAYFEIPKGGSPWHEYASYNGAVHTFFPDVKLAPFLPADFIAKNRQMLLSKSAILRESGMGANWRSTDPLFLPEAFFQKYPHMRGPRVDHPRRSLQQEFSACFHQKETVEMYQDMVDQLFKNVPEINSFNFNLNDAGSGLCWADLGYSGPNGPSGEKDIPISVSAVTVLNIFKDAAKEFAGHDIEIIYGNMLTAEEIDDLIKNEPENCYVQGRNSPPSKNMSSMLIAAWPVRGIINPMQIMKSLTQTMNSSPGRYSFGFGDMYNRGQERMETIEKIIDIVEDNFKNPSGEGTSDSLKASQLLKKWCVKWAGPKSAEQLYNAFVTLDTAIKKRDKLLSNFYINTYYYGVSVRHITRPLVFAPQRLTPDEEKYFLPHIFNVSVDAARNEYMDLHGSDRFMPERVADNFLMNLKIVFTSIEKIKDAPEQKFLDDMVRSLKIYYSVVRSVRNFNDAQVIRNRNKEILAGPVHLPPRIANRTGDKDLQEFNGIMRNEFDNTQELIDLLQNGGMDFVCHAVPPVTEDTFLLGANLIEQLKQKRKIMMAHWRDIEGYLTTPHI